MRNLDLGISVWLFSTLLVVAQAVAASEDRFLTVQQMKSRGVAQGLPFLWHGGMWGDFLFISPILGILAYHYADQWPGRAWLLAIGGGMIASGLLHITYAKAPLPGAHAHDGTLTTAGWLHLLYMGFALGELALFYFATAHPSPKLTWTVSAGLVCHLIAGSHMLFGSSPPEWLGQKPLQSVFGWSAILVTALLVGWRAIVILR